MKQQQLQDAQRKGRFTPAIVARTKARTIACFSTGPSYAGENHEDLLARKIAELHPPSEKLSVP